MANDVLVLGGTGQLGRALCAALERGGRDVRAPVRAELDLEHTAEVAEAVRVGRFRTVYNAAAYTDVNGAERPEEALRVQRLNRDLPRELARACALVGTRLLHVSTDYVFDGTKGEPYVETDPVRPLQQYGRSKLEGERAALGVNPATLVARTSTRYGPGPRERPHYVDAILRQARAGDAISVVRPPVASPTHAPDLAEWLIALEPLDVAGVLHTVNDGGCRRAELARAAVRAAGLGGRVTVTERPDPTGGLARPADARLDTAKLAGLLGRPPRGWQHALEAYVRAEPAA